MKKILLLMWLLLSLILPACQKQMTYHEMHEAEQLETDPVAKEKLEERIREFEKTAEKAHSFYSNRAACQAGKGTVWLCVGYGERYDDKHPPETLDEIVKVYRDDRHTCGCSNRSDLSGLF